MSGAPTGDRGGAARPAAGALPEPARARRRQLDLPGPRQLEAMLEECGALRRGHFILSSGLHSPVYIQCALLLEQPRRAELVGRALARRLAPLRPDSVLAPALGGLIIGHEVASALGVPFRFSERREGRMELRRSFHLEAGERVVLVEDVVTTGKSTLETADVVQQAGAEVVAVGSIIRRYPGDADAAAPAGGDRDAADRVEPPNPFEVPFFPLLVMAAPTYDPESGEPRPDWGEPERPGSRTPAGG